MPIFRREIAQAGKTYGSAFVGPVDHTVQILIDVSGLTDDEVDQYGYLKPGVPFTKAGVLVAALGFVYGVTIEAIKVADDNAAPTLAAATDVMVAVGVIGVVNRDAAEEMLGRAYTAAEIAGFDLAGSKLVLLS